MLELRNISKTYNVGDTKTEALKDISISFRKNEFVAVLGPSGCGKTTLLNVIGGLDKYDVGEMTVNGRPTKEYRDADWDSYRNHSIGFVFQSYNLIPHQTVLANVELALTLSGVSKSQRKERALNALARVGIADQAGKKPNQLSGGQMQRVAIARALVNNPEILLADEPTGALDSATSIQIMEILKEISAEKLVIMVTHNPELAQQYATRTVNLFDGKITSDSNFYISSEKPDNTVKKTKSAKTSMSLLTALSLSLNNLMTKKTRTLLTSFAGSIGIIGIALILSLSSGFRLYINKVQEDTLSTYPITIASETMDMSGMLEAMMENSKSELDHDLDKVYSNTVMSKMLNTMFSQIEKNDLNAFREYLIQNEETLKPYVSDIQYGYGVKMDIYTSGTDEYVKVNPSTVFADLYGMDTESGGASFGNPYAQMDVWNELIGNNDLLDSQYDKVYGSWPQNYDEVVLFVNEDNEISDYVLYALGIKDQSEIKQMISDAILGREIDEDETSYSYEELCNLTYSLVLAADHYEYYEESGIYKDKSKDVRYVGNLVENGIQLKVVGIMRPKVSASATSFTGAIGYTHGLTERYIELTNQSEIVKRQQSTATDEAASAKYGKTLRFCDVDVFTGIPFGFEPENASVTIDDVNAYIATLPEEQQTQIKAMLSAMSEEQIIAMFEKEIEKNTETTLATLESNLALLGANEISTPKSVNIYASDFAAKEFITNFIEDYNRKMTEQGFDDKVISYTDYIGIMLSSIGTIIDTISYVLIAFVAISLIVSSIMIGIITYISVLERTKEIGILRSIGASKKDITRVFNAETLIVGFTAGMLGIIATLLLNIPVNLIIESLAEISGVAKLPVEGAVILVAISMLLTLVAGLIPSKLAAKKDPVVALRTE